MGMKRSHRLLISDINIPEIMLKEQDIFLFLIEKKAETQLHINVKTIFQ